MCVCVCVCVCVCKAYIEYACFTRIYSNMYLRKRS